MHLLLLLLLRDQARLLLCQPSPNRTSLLGPEVERDVFLVLVKKPQLCALVRIDDCEDPCNRLSDMVAA